VTDVPYPQDIDRLVGNIRTELHAQLGMARLELDESVIESLAVGIASNIDYAFEFRWRPRWVPSGDAHRWTESSESGDEQHFVECLQCKRITVHESAAEGDAWYAEHVSQHA
jgi:hypothetical protein